MSSGQTPQNPIPPLTSSRPASSQPPLASYPLAPQESLPTSSVPSPMAQEPDPMFDAVAHSQGGMPHLLQYLSQRFRAHVQTLNEAQPQASYDATAMLQAAEPVLSFFQQFLQRHRPVEMFPLDMNHGFMLDNNDRMALCPGVPDDMIRGSMQDSGAIGISSGRGNNQDGSIQV